MNESTWLKEWQEVDPSQEALPGITVGEFVDFYRRPPTPQGAAYRENVVYGTAGRGGRDLHLFLYARADLGERRPGVVLIHGGGWAGGHPFMHIRHACELAARGYVTATISYRLSGEAVWPAALEDAKCAVRWMRAHSEEIGLDGERLAVSGGSAGGHLSAMIALTPGKFEGEGGWEDQPSTVKCAVLWYPMTDMHAPGGNENAQTLTKAFLGDSSESVIREASPLTYVNRDCPPIFTMAGDQDETTPLEMIRDFHRLLDDHGVENSLRVYEGKAHAFDLYPPEAVLEAIDRLQEFLDGHL